jgi:nicotinamide mononucleotide transporter
MTDLKTRHYAEAVILASVLTVTSYVLAEVAGWQVTTGWVHWVEVLAVWTSYVSTWLCVRQRRWNYVWGSISSVLYAVLFLQSNLLASAILNAYLAPALAYGWVRWRQDTNTRPVANLKWRWVPVYAISTAVAYWGAVQVAHFFGGSMAAWDSVILIGTILAQFLLDNKKLQTWYVWAVVNVIAIITYSTSGLWLVAFQYVLFLINTYIGYRVWKKSLIKQSRELYKFDINTSRWPFEESTGETTIKLKSEES